MAAQAEQDAADFRATGGNAVGQNFDVLSVVAEGDGLAIERARVLSPESITTGIGNAAVTGAERSAMRSMAARAAAALIVVCAEYVDRRGPILCHHQSRDGQYEDYK